MTTAVDLSYDHLPDGARRMFPLLALFPAGVTEDAARFFWEEEGVEALETLLQFSMAEKPEQAVASQRFELPRRFELPEPARRYAESQQLSDAMQHIAPKALNFFYNFVERATALIANEQDRHQGRLLLTLEQPNLDKFLSWGYQNENSQDGVCHSARITALLTSFWLFNRSDTKTIMPRLADALKAAERNGDQLGNAQTKKATGDVWRWENDIDQALSSYLEALALFQALNNRLNQAQVFRAIGDLYLLQQTQERVDLAKQNYEKAIPLFIEAGGFLEAAQTQEAIADILKNGATEELDTVAASYNEALALYERADNKLGAAQTYKKLGDTYASGASEQELDAGVQDYDAAVKLFKKVFNWLKAGQAQEAMANLQRARSGPKTAIPMYAEASRLYLNWNSPSDAARVLRKMADAQRESDNNPNICRSSYEDALSRYEQAEMWQQAAEVQTTIGELWLKNGEEGRAVTSFRGAAEKYETLLHMPLEAAQLRERMGDVRVVTVFRPELAIPDYEKAKTLFINAGKEGDQRRVQRKIWNLE